MFGKFSHAKAWKSVFALNVSCMAQHNSPLLGLSLSLSPRNIRNLDIDPKLVCSSKLVTLELVWRSQFTGMEQSYAQKWNCAPFSTF